MKHQGANGSRVRKSHWARWRITKPTYCFPSIVRFESRGILTKWIGADLGVNGYSDMQISIILSTFNENGKNIMHPFRKLLGCGGFGISPGHQPFMIDFQLRVNLQRKNQQ